MRTLSSAILMLLLLSSCVTRPYDGPSVVEVGGQLVCGRHRVPVKAHKGYLFNGLIHFIDDDSQTFASDRYPNVLVRTFSEKRSEDYSLPYIDYTCPGCEAGHAKLKRLPMWYKRIAGFPAMMRRELAIERAAAKAKKTGNPEDAKVRYGDGHISRIR
jgi:hypothetical protein